MRAYSSVIAAALFLTATVAVSAPPLSEPIDVTVINQVPVTVAGEVDVSVTNEEVDVSITNDASNPVPVAPRLPIAESGEWFSGGFSLPPMILHDLIIYAEDLGDQTSCRFTLYYRVQQQDLSFELRRLKYFNIGLNGSAELHSEAGIDTTTIAFGTETAGGEQCKRNWAAFGYALP